MQLQSHSSVSFAQLWQLRKANIAFTFKKEQEGGPRLVSLSIFPGKVTEQLNPGNYFQIHKREANH